MAYKVDRFNGTFLTSVEDGTIDTTTDLRFVGKNYAGYGEVQNENFLHLMENFANSTSPPKVVTGQIWYDTTNKKLKFYDGTRFKVAGGAEVSTTAPDGLAIGEFWWDSSAKQLYAYTGSEYVLVGPEASPDLGTSAVSAQVVKDTLNNNHSIVKVLSGGKTMIIVSQDAFELNASELLKSQGFTLIKKGVTLVNTNSDGVSTLDHYYWGTASDANRLAGLPASAYLRKADVSFDAEISFKDPGFNVGNDNDFRLRVENGNQVVLENRLGNELTFRITLVEGADERDVMVIDRNGVKPSLDAAYNLGTSLARWNNVYGVTFTGNLVGNVTGNIVGEHTGTVRAADTTVMINSSTKLIGYDGATLRGTLFGNVQGNCAGTADNATLLTSLAPSVTIPVTAIQSIPVRDASGNIYANTFIGTSSRADQLLVGSTYRSSAITSAANTIAARDSAGDITANLFKGTATAARYADLAEKYLADADYEVGTVVMVGGEKEVTLCETGSRALGVVSANPAFMMNKDLEGGTYIALKGRVPVKVHGPVAKGDELVAGYGGIAVRGEGKVFAIALENNDNPEVKLIEAVVL